MNNISLETSALLRLPPQSVESEIVVLGALLLDNNVFEHVGDIVSEGDFYRSEHRTIFSVIKSLIEQDKPADLITVFDSLQNNGGADAVGGLAYLNSLAQFVPSAHNAKNYAEHIRESSIKRKMIAASDQIASSAYEPKGRTTAEILDEAEQAVLCIEQLRNHDREILTLDQHLDDSMARLEYRAEHPNQLNGISSGYVDMDKKINGFKPGDLIVIAGRPSMGKTSLAMNIAEHSAIKESKAVLIVSLEMPASQLTDRILGSVGRVDQSRLQTGQLEGDEWSRITDTYESLRGKPLEIEDSGVNTVAGIRAVARRALRRNKTLSLIVVDYLQLMVAAGAGENRNSEIEQISRGLKKLAMDMQCPVIVVAQLNRGVESRNDKRPMMSDLRDSGAIEQDADIVMLLYRDEYYTKDLCREPGVAEINISKHRNGPTGVVKLAWLPSFTRFDNLAY
uniref:Replicative DNA helicase n=1 Tax=Polaromonas sp. E10S TaxID=1840239 RepID=A0A2S1FHY4_9BURK|nr:replicative DNA helicase [Polaromonas sp. E10S]AWD71949.1 DNA helicase DnaB [Polaromonas sp. E10S]